MRTKKRDALNGSIKTRKANLSNSQARDDILTFVMISDQNEGERFDWWSGESYLERLDINGANTSKLNTFFKNHNRGVDDAVGRVEKTYVEGTSLLGDVVFDESGTDLKRKYENGTLTDVSIGYRINKYEVEEREGELDIVTITDFDIVELSAVGIGFDAGAKKRESEKGDLEEMKDLKKRLAELEKITKRTADENVELEKVRKELDKETEKENIRLKEENEEAQRKLEILNIANSYGVGDSLREKFEKEGTAQEFMRAILDERKGNQPQVIVRANENPNKNDLMDAMADAIVQKAGVRVSEPHKDTDRFRGASLIDIAKDITGINSYDKNDIAGRAMNTADFPLLLVKAGNRVLESAYDEQQSTYQIWVKETELPDFKTQTNITLGQTGRLSKMNEQGEFKEQQLTESSEDWKIESYGAEFVLTRQMIINDDLGAFTNLLSEFGKMAKRTSNGIVYDLLQSKNDYANYKMKDGKPIFHAGHGNILGAITPLSAESLEKAKISMMRQKSEKGNPLNIVPKYLIVAPEQEVSARILLTSMSSIEANKNSGVINPFYNMLEIIVDAELESGAWYLASDNRTIKAGYLAGTGRKPIVKMDTQSLTKTVFQGVFDFGVVAEDYRSLYKNGK